MSDDAPTIVRLKDEVRRFPTLPGVYIMRDVKGEVIYVGKAKSLRARVRSYFAGGDGRAQIAFLVRRIDSIETIVTDSEEQAFVLERDLITKYKPRYNIRLKDDKAYLNVRIDDSVEWPRLELVRRVEQDGARYYGPYTFSHELRGLLDIINQVIPLRTCRDTVFYNRQRPCLEYQIKRCAGPCCLPVDKEEYAEWVRQAVSILEGKTAPLVKEFESRMERASEELRFEDAARYRDKVTLLENFAKGQQFISSGAEDRDVFALYREERLATLSVLKVRLGRISDNKNFSFQGVEVRDEEIVEAAIEQYYSGGREIPEEIIVPMELENESILREFLKEKRGAKVSFTFPQRGLKFRLLQLALVNAQQHYRSTFDEESRAEEIAKSLARMFTLKQVPRRIECIDISNLQGSDIVGALVVFFDGKADRSSYRRYKISAQGKPDDFGAVREVVTRRLRRGLEEETLPDLLIIDGGKGQLGAAIEARDALGVDLEIVALAKARSERKLKHKGTKPKTPERIFLEGAADPIPLDATSEVTHYLARIRDEVHRFVIGFHRATRKKRVFMSILDEIPGIGPERKRRLMKQFGSIAGMRGASEAELAKAGRMSKLLARKILERLKES